MSLFIWTQTLVVIILGFCAGMIWWIYDSLLEPINTKQAKNITISLATGLLFASILMMVALYFGFEMFKDQKKILALLIVLILGLLVIDAFLWYLLVDINSLRRAEEDLGTTPPDQIKAFSGSYIRYLRSLFKRKKSSEEPIPDKESEFEKRLDKTKTLALQLSASLTAIVAFYVLFFFFVGIVKFGKKCPTSSSSSSVSSKFI